MDKYGGSIVTLTINCRIDLITAALSWKLSDRTHNCHIDSKLNFFDHINEKIKKATKGINVIRKMNLSLPRSSLLTIYKSFLRPHLDYGDVIYDQLNNSSLSIQIESVQQYNAAQAITGAITETSKEKLYQELGLESFRNGRWLRRMSYLY